MNACKGDSRSGWAQQAPTAAAPCQSVPRDPRGRSPRATDADPCPPARRTRTDCLRAAQCPRGQCLHRVSRLVRDKNQRAIKDNINYKLLLVQSHHTYINIYIYPPFPRHTLYIYISRTVGRTPNTLVGKARYCGHHEQLPASRREDVADSLRMRQCRTNAGPGIAAGLSAWGLAGRAHGGGLLTSTTENPSGKSSPESKVICSEEKFSCADVCQRRTRPPTKMSA
jgi:hypothetical protein